MSSKQQGAAKGRRQKAKARTLCRQHVQGVVNEAVQVLHLARVDHGAALDEQRSLGKVEVGGTIGAKGHCQPLQLVQVLLQVLGNVNVPVRGQVLERLQELGVALLARLHADRNAGEEAAGSALGVETQWRSDKASLQAAKGYAKCKRRSTAKNHHLPLCACDCSVALLRKLQPRLVRGQRV